jgi:BirA family transcriptional regulator, biotin operon repressor / biotin---[acetyl-CoA-carboxylase] ligase
MIGRPRVHHRVTDSTSLRARELAAGGAPHGTVVTAGEQTAGRGRHGRAWMAPPGHALLMSVVLRELDERTPLVPLTAAVALCSVLEGLEGVSGEIAIKWPNDVWIDGRKVAGILVEGRPQEGWAVLGIGVNALSVTEDFPDELRETAISVAMAGGSAGPAALLEALLSTLEPWLERDAGAVLSAWRERDGLLGREIGWDTQGGAGGGGGVAAGVDGAGALLVDTEGGRVSLDAGEVHLMLPSG